MSEYQDQPQQQEFGSQYKEYLFFKWSRIMEIAEEFRINVMEGEQDHTTTYTYVSRLSLMWIELLPKIEGRSEFKGLEEQFINFKDVYFNPEKIISSDEEDDEDSESERIRKSNKVVRLFEMEQVIRRVLEKMGITSFESGKYG